MKKLLSVFAIALFSTPALAMDMDFEIESVELFKAETPVKAKPGKGHPHKKMCQDLNFSPTQKQAYTEARKTLTQHMARLGKRMKNTVDRYKKVLTNTKVPGQKADQVATRLRRLGGKMMEIRTDFFHTIVYDIASVDQREGLLKCVRQIRHHIMMQKMKKYCNGGGHGGEKPGKKPDAGKTPVEG